MVFENNDFLVIDKPSGLVVHLSSSLASEGKGKIYQESSLIDWIVKRYPEVKSVGDNLEFRPGIVHRLDKDTSGVMVVARNQETFDYLKRLFEERQVEKRYLALVYGKLKSGAGRIEKPIALKAGTTKRTVFGGKMEKEAVTEYKVLRDFKCKHLNSRGKGEGGVGVSLVEARPKTGRTHQIRVHLSSIGHPVVNDFIYAKKRERIGSGRLMLHAESIEFRGQSGEFFSFEVPPPRDFKEIEEIFKT